ncbi:E3 ubiquitin-protein ligase synoviolin [Rhizophagus clarus]|uniref:RING-type E3 ubiquitin transferase n=1 Tax=Rhizophagus clarus TaxID=94130 RepID=A0A8H3QH68_9GLOM|nr:E3 ubiquitin-protein ligase synoviolin [Rhizophagus clarus]
MVRLVVYGGISTFLTLSIIAAAFRQRPNFYAACIYLSKSSACIMILMNMGFFLTIVLGKILQTVFFGSLRAVEIEHLYERAWYAFTETCLAMTIFRDEFNTSFVVTFTILLFLKIFHWLCQDRVEFMEQSPAVPISFHIRMISLMEILGIIDLILASYAINIAMHNEPNMMIMFAFEYSILTATILSTIIKYILNVIDMRREEQWENKSIYVFYLELVTDFIKLIVYLIFFAIILVFYGIALHIIRDLYVTLRSFLQKCGDLIRYRRATRNMNERYPSATNEELERLSDRTCIICREEMIAAAAVNNNANNNNDAEPQRHNNGDRRQGSNNNMGDVPKKLPCGHIFHFHCLRSWLERQQSCPTCRRPVLEQQTPAVQLQQQQRPIQAQAARNGLQGQPQQPQLPQANLPNMGEQDNDLNQNIQQPLQQPNNSQDTRQDVPQNTQSTDTEGRAATETNEESSSTSNAHSQNNSTRRSNQPVTPRMPWDQLSSSASRTFILPNNSNSSSSTLEPLTEEQIRLLETNTRAAFEEKIRILQEAQMQIYNVISVLTQAVSAFPSVPITELNTATSSAEENSLINNNEGENNIGNANLTNFTNASEISQNEVKGNKGKGKSVTVTDEEEPYS